MARNPGKIHFSEKDFAKYSGKIKGLGEPTTSASRPRKKRGKWAKKAGIFSGKGFLGLGRSTQRIRVNKNSEAKSMTEPTAKQKRARSKNRNHPTPKQIAARKKFAAMSKRRAREAKAANRGTVTRKNKRQPGASRNPRGKKTGSVTRSAKKTPAQSNKSKPRAFTKQVVAKHAKRNTGRSRNSALAVNEVFKTFVGRDSHNISDVDFPNGTPTNLAQLGKLTELKSETETFQFTESEGVYLAADARGNLYVGGKQQPVEPNTHFGRLLGVSYVCKKTHIEAGQTIEYVHKFGEEGGKCPRLRSDAEGRFLISGGTYTITSGGIAD